jgi:hypothetical protein
MERFVIYLLNNSGELVYSELPLEYWRLYGERAKDDDERSETIEGGSKTDKAIDKELP